MSFLLFDLFPILQDLLGPVHVHIGKNVGVATDELVDDSASYLLDAEAIFLGGDLGVKDDLQ